MSNVLRATDKFLPAIDHESLADEPRTLPGLYPWLRFGQYFTRADWVEAFGINLDQIDQKAATVYLDGEADFFEGFANEIVPIIGYQRATALRQTKLEGMRRLFIRAATSCGSPIEQIMLAALIWARYGYERKLVEIWDSADNQPQADVVIATQHHAENHRVDFALFINIVANEQIKIVVECDGHEWHEKTKEQAARDKRRNRDLGIAGWRLLRFTGSEIWRDPRGCAGHVAALVTNEIEAQLQRRGFLDSPRGSW